MDTFPAPTVARNPKKRPREETESSHIAYQPPAKRREDEFSRILSFMEQGLHVRLNAKAKKAAVKSCRIITKRTLSLEEHRRVIWLRFGSLESTEKAWHTSSEVYKLTGVKPTSQCSLIKRWLERGKQLVSLKHLRGRKLLLTYEQRAYAANPKTLMEMRHLSLEQRAAALKERFGLSSLSAPTVSACYREFGASYRKP